MTDAGWTAEVPKEIGVYWWRSNAADNHPWIVRVHKGWLGLMLMQTMGGPLVTIGDGGEWLGPITPDSYQQGRVEGLREYREVVARELQLDHSNHPTRFKASIIEALDKADFEVSKQAAQDEKGVGE